MGIFSGPATSDGAATSVRRRVDAHTLSIIAPDLAVTGDLRAESVVRIEGRVAGNVVTGGQILLSQGGVVEGNLETREAILAGEVHGNVTATERVEIQPTAVIHGDIITPRLLIQEGGRLNGAIRMEATVSRE